MNANADAIDALAPVGGLCIATTETPSTTLRVQAAGGRFQSQDGSVAAFAGAPAINLAPQTTTSIYLTDSGEVQTSSTGFPTTSHVPLAIVETSTTAVTSVIDLRVVCATVGRGSRPFLSTSGGELDDGATLTLGSDAGLKIGTAASQKIGFWNATPRSRPGPYVQSYSTAVRTVAAYSPAAVSTPYTGIASGQGGTPYAQIADVNALRLAYENLRLRSENTTQVLNALIQDLKTLGLLG